jgi:hypothetical protein
LILNKGIDLNERAKRFLKWKKRCLDQRQISKAKKKDFFDNDLI